MFGAVKMAYELGGTVAVGLTAAAVVGTSPLVGAGMVAVAYVVSQVAEPVFKTTPNFEDDGFRGGVATCAVWASCAATIAQLVQWSLSCVGYSMRTLPSFGIVGSALFLGPILGEMIHKQVNPNVVNEYDFD